MESILDRHLKHTMSRRSTAIGSPHWMAPEVIASIPEPQEVLDEQDTKKGYDHHCDVWSLGKNISLFCTMVKEALDSSFESASSNPSYLREAPKLNHILKTSLNPLPYCSQRIRV